MSLLARNPNFARLFFEQIEIAQKREREAAEAIAFFRAREVDEPMPEISALEMEAYLKRYGVKP